MNRSLRSKKNISSRSAPNVWRKGEDVFGHSPSPVKRKPTRRETKMGLKKFSEKISPKIDRRRSVYLKRLESDFKISESEVISRKRTTRQSLANIPKAESKTVRSPIQRAKSEKSIPKKKISPAKFKSPSVKLEKLKLENFDTKSKYKESSRKLSPASISKETFYSKSPVKTRQIRRQSMARLSKLEKMASKDESPKTSRTEVKKNQSQPIIKISSEKPSTLKQKAVRKSENRSQPIMKISSEKPSTLKQKAIVKSETSEENFLKEKSPQRDKVPEEKTHKTKTPRGRPMKKRLSALTPSPLTSRTKRLTRSAVRKRVKISADSPSASAEFRKTPKSFANQRKITDIHISPSILKPFTPKPEEPLKILRQNLKRNVDTEIRISKQNLKRNVDTEIRNSKQREVSDVIPVSIVSARKPLKSSASSPAVAYSEKGKRSPKKISKESPVKNGINHHHHQEESYSSSSYIPSTPVSSRKSTVSFRRFRGSVRLTEEESQKKSDTSESNLSLKNPLRITPVRLGAENEDYDETSMDFSEDSSTHEESKYSLSSFTASDNSYNDHHIEGIEGDVSNENVEQKSSKKSYCSLM